MSFIPHFRKLISRMCSLAPICNDEYVPGSNQYFSTLKNGRANRCSKLAVSLTWILTSDTIIKPELTRIISPPHIFRFLIKCWIIFFWISLQRILINFSQKKSPKHSICFLKHLGKIWFVFNSKRKILYPKTYLKLMSLLLTNQPFTSVILIWWQIIC